jgi:hypothetical protein
MDAYQVMWKEPDLSDPALSTLRKKVHKVRFSSPGSSVEEGEE